ncbi:MAG: protein kinase [Planctomycetes bacterium]|nr:protein kinase [Planctomycetota bacterium]
MNVACPKCKAPLPQPPEPKTTTVKCPGCGVSVTIQYAPPPAKKPAASDQYTLTPGTVLGGFRVDGPLGAGGMASVYRATQISLNRKVALKVLPVALANDPHFVQRFDRESDILASLNHPCIITIYDKGSDKGYYYFAMEIVEGGTLRDLMTHQRLTPAIAFRVVCDVCDALQFAHRQGVIHRDMKPTNVLLDKEGRVKVADFGIAHLARHGEQAVNELTMTNVRMGTQHYMAPEQQFDAKSVDGRADIYSLGVMLYEMLCGQLPIGSFDLPSQRIPGLDSRIDQVIQRSLKTDPAQRYGSPSEIATILREVATSAPTADEQPSIPGATMPASRAGARAHHLANTVVPPSAAGGRRTSGVQAPPAATEDEPATSHTLSGRQVSEADRCPRCQFANKPGARVCLGCGSSLSRKCPKCKKDIPLRAETCEACGLSVATYLEEALTGTRKSLDQVEDFVQRGDYAAGIERLNALLRTPGEEFAELREKARRRLAEVNELAEAESRKVDGVVARGQQHFDRHEYELALEAWRSVPGVPASKLAEADKRLAMRKRLIAEGDAAAAAGNAADARARYEEAMEYTANLADLEVKLQGLKDASGKRRVDTLLSEAKGLVAQKKYEEALGIWKKALELAPDRADIQKLLDQGRAALADHHYKQGRKLQGEGKQGEAREALSRARRYAPEREDIEAAVAALDEERAGAKADDLLQQAEKAREAGDRERALELLKEAAALDPEHPVVRAKLAALGGPAKAPRFAKAQTGGGGGLKVALVVGVPLLLVGAFAAAYYGKRLLDGPKPGPVDPIKDPIKDPTKDPNTNGETKDPAKRLADATSRLKAAEDAFASGPLDDAARAFEAVAKEFDGTEPGKAAAARVADIVKYKKDAGELLEKAQAAQKAKNFREAAAQFKKAADDFGKDPRTASAAASAAEATRAAEDADRRLSEAEALARSDKPEKLLEAKAAFEKMIAEQASTEWCEKAKAKLKEVEKRLADLNDEVKRLLVAKRQELQEALNAKRDLDRLGELIRELEKDDTSRDLLNRALPKWQELPGLLAQVNAAAPGSSERIAAWEQVRLRLRGGWRLPEAAAKDFEALAKALFDAGSNDADAAKGGESLDKAYAAAEQALQCESGEQPHHLARRIKALGLTDPRRKTKDFQAALDVLSGVLDLARFGEDAIDSAITYARVVNRWKEAPPSVREDAIRRLTDVIQASQTRATQRCDALKYRAYLFEGKGELASAARDLEQSLTEPEHPERAECSEVLAEILWKMPASDAATRGKAIALLEKVAPRRPDLLAAFLGFLDSRPPEPAMMDVARKLLGTSPTQGTLHFLLCYNAARAGHRLDSKARSDLQEREKWLQEALDRRRDLAGDELKEAIVLMMACVVHMKLDKFTDAKREQAELSRLVDRHKGEKGEDGPKWDALRRQSDANQDFLQDK